jgi:hypothetical protein
MQIIIANLALDPAKLATQILISVTAASKDFSLYLL